MQFLVIERDAPDAGAGRMRRMLAGEAQAVWTLLVRDILRHIWFTTDHRAVLLLECPDLDAARTVLQSLPLYLEGLIDFEISALLPYDGFERLFAPPETS